MELTPSLIASFSVFAYNICTMSSEYTCVFLVHGSYSVWEAALLFCSWGLVSLVCQCLYCLCVFFIYLLLFLPGFLHAAVLPVPPTGVLVAIILFSFPNHTVCEHSPPPPPVYVPLGSPLWLAGNRPEDNWSSQASQLSKWCSSKEFVLSVCLDNIIFTLM